jgi:hypothetical protein
MTVLSKTYEEFKKLEDEAIWYSVVPLHFTKPP